MNLVIHALTFILYLAYLIFLGHALLKIIAPPRRSQNMAERAPTAFLLGTGVLCVLVLPLSIAGITIQAWMLLLVGGIVGGTAAILKRKPDQGTSLPWAGYEFITFSILAFLLAVHFLVISAYPQFDIDMIGHILMKAKILSDSSYANAVYLHDPVFATAHNNYPPLTVFLQGFMFLLGLNAIADYQALNCIIFFLTGVALHTALRTRIGAVQSLAWSFILISTANYLHNQFLISSTDIYFSLAILLTSLAFLEIRSDTNACENTLFSVLCACTLLIKNDAVLFIGLITLGLWIKTRRFPARHLLIMAVLTGPWMLYRMTLPDPETGAELILKHFSTYLLPQSFPRLIHAVVIVLTQSLNHIFLISLCTWPFLLRSKDLRILMACTLLTIFGYIILIWSAIPLSIGDEAPGLLRLCTQVYPLTIFITALSLNAIAKPDQH